MVKAITNTGKKMEMSEKLDKLYKRVSEMEVNLAQLAIKLEAISEILLNKNVYDTKELQDASTEMVRIMYKLPKDMKIEVTTEAPQEIDTNTPDIPVDADCYEIEQSKA